ncbi:MAG: hypothetical protein ACM3ZV_07300 [Bacillota bacterium]
MNARSTQGIVRKFAKQHTAAPRRTHQPVHRRSYHAGEREQREWLTHNRFPRSEENARHRALQEIEEQERYVDRGDRKRRREAYVMRGVYRYLLRLRGQLNGRLDPTYATIARALHYAESAVKAAVKRLAELGFLRWIRRTRPIEDPAPGGQYVEQISNAYVLELSGRAADLVRKILRRPTPEQARRRDEQQRPAQADGLSDEELVAGVADGALRRSLGRMLDGLRGGASPPTGLNGTL